MLPWYLGLIDRKRYRFDCIKNCVSVFVIGGWEIECGIILLNGTVGHMTRNRSTGFIFKTTVTSQAT